MIYGVSSKQEDTMNDFISQMTKHEKEVMLSVVEKSKKKPSINEFMSYLYNAIPTNKEEVEEIA